MAFTDPQSITVNAVPHSMPRIELKGTSAVYATADGLWKLTISHTPSKDRIRSMARFEQKAIVTNPLDQTNDYDALTFYVVIDRPQFGFTMVQTEQQITGFNTWLTNAIVDKLFGQES